MSGQPQLRLPSRTGLVFDGEVSVDPDGALVIVTIYGHGYRSAHRDHARKHFGTGNLALISRVSWKNRDGVRVALTCWKPSAAGRPIRAGSADA